MSRPVVTLMVRVVFEVEVEAVVKTTESLDDASEIGREMARELVDRTLGNYRSGAKLIGTPKAETVHFEASYP